MAAGQSRRILLPERRRGQVLRCAEVGYDFVSERVERFDSLIQSQSTRADQRGRGVNEKEDTTNKSALEGIVDRRESRVPALTRGDGEEP